VLAHSCRTASGTRVDVQWMFHEYYGACNQTAMDASLAGPEPSERAGRMAAVTPGCLQGDADAHDPGFRYSVATKRRTSPSIGSVFG
jgi:hypothetical protein